jgi:tetratricopeptide (TPR) repeat protein
MTSVDTLYQQADQLKEEGKYDEAISKLHELLAVDSNHALSHLGLAVLYGKVGQHDKAVEHGRLACAAEPNEPFNFTALSITCQRAWAGTQNRQYIQEAEEAMAKAHMLQGRG